MEKDLTTEIKEDNKAAFIVRASGTFLPEEYLKTSGQDKGDIPIDEYKKFIRNVIVSIYENLLSTNENLSFDSVGIWLTLDGDRKLETSMDIATLDLIKESHNIDPIGELAQMILETAYESKEDI